MDILEIKGERDTPSVLLNQQNGEFIIHGDSYPENVKKVYDPILNWFNSYIINPNNETTLKFKYDYFNTASAQMILELLTLFEENDVPNTKVIWLFKEGDEDMEEAGEGFQEMLDLDISLESYSEI
ncbi:MAG: DUF1987 domain-containing protein [Flavobacteriales bacterium]|nr:DUF1987 domain-containing protein [Flavobacteriales bacterium]